MQDQDAPPAETPFQLPNSGLALNGTRLVRRMPEGGIVAEFELAEMSGIEFRAKSEPVMFVLGLGFTAVAAVLVVKYTASAWAWVGAVGAICLGVFFAIGARQHCLVFWVGKTRLEFPILDATEDGRAFAIMLQQAQRRPRR